MSEFLEQLAKLVDKNGLLTGEDVSSRSPGWSHYHAKEPESSVLVRPKTTEQVSEVLKLCHKHQQTVVTQGGKTGLVGATVSKGSDLILSLERMTSIEHIDTADGTMLVQAGAPLQTVQEGASDKGLMFPLDLGARGTATIGGNIATNAGGIRVIRYGMARQLILGLEVVLADGTIVNALNGVVKNNTGYDIKQLFIGSEGTLGIITRAVLKLSPAQNSQNTAIVALDNYQQVISFLNHCKQNLSGSLSAFEVMWDSFFALTTADSDVGLKSPFANTHPFYAIVETLGNDQKSDQEDFESTLEAALENGDIVDAVIAQTHHEIESIWALRENLESLQAINPFFTFDVSVPIVQMETYIENIKTRLATRWPDPYVAVFGHLGDGNLHLQVAVGENSNEIRLAIEKIVYGELQQWKGAISAEHGIGLEKKAFLHYSRNAEEIGLMKTLKHALDPQGLLNPGKIFSV